MDQALKRAGTSVRSWGPLAAVAGAAGLAHLPTLFNGFVWDDVTFVLGNPVLRDPANALALFTKPETWGTGTVNPYYRPLTTLTFMSDTLLWGASPAGFHATNVLLHLGVCLLLLAVLRRLVAPGAALAAALLFAVHPAHAEPVAYVSARGDLLCALLLLAAFLAWMRHGDTGGRAKLALSALAYGAALLAKIAAGLFPAVFALHGALCFRRRPRARDLLPFAAVAFAYLAARAAVLDMEVWPNPPLADRAATAGTVVVRYALMALSPAHLRVHHDLPVRTSFDTAAVTAWVLLAAALAFAALRLRQAPRVALGFAWFLAGVAPVSGLVTILQPTLVADRYLYLPLIGAAIAAAAGLERLAALLPAPRRRLAAGAAALLLLALAGATAWRGRLWRDSVTFWEQAALEAPGSQHALNGLGLAYARAGRDRRATRALLASLEINEASPRAHLGLATAAIGTGNLAGALRHAQRAIELSPESAPAHRILGIALLLSGRRELAREAAERAFSLNPFDESTRWLVGQFDGDHPSPTAR